MDEIEFLKKLDGRSQDAAPHVDVAERVVATLRYPIRIHPTLAAPASLWLATGLSWAAAAACLLIAIQAVDELQDPFNDLMNSVTMVMR